MAQSGVPVINTLQTYGPSGHRFYTQYADKLEEAQHYE
jgi:hypothetical protein